jgi:hypothetical protein
MKEDFLDTIRKQWDDQEIMEAIEVVAEWYPLEKWRAKK